MNGIWETTRPSLGSCGWRKKGALPCVEVGGPAVLRQEPVTVSTRAPGLCALEAIGSGQGSLAYCHVE